MLNYTTYYTICIFGSYFMLLLGIGTRDAILDALKQVEILYIIHTIYLYGINHEFGIQNTYREKCIEINQSKILL